MLFHLFLLFNYVLHRCNKIILVINYCYLTWEKATFSHLDSVVHIPLKVTLPCVNIGLSWNATQLIIPVSFVEPVAREHNWNPAVLTDSAHTAEGEWTTEDWSSWLNDTKTRTWNALGKDRQHWKFIRRQFHPRLWAVSLFFPNPLSETRETRVTLRVTEGARMPPSFLASARHFCARLLHSLNLKKKRV